MRATAAVCSRPMCPSIINSLTRPIARPPCRQQRYRDLACHRPLRMEGAIWPQCLWIDTVACCCFNRVVTGGLVMATVRLLSPSVFPSSTGNREPRVRVPRQRVSISRARRSFYSPHKRSGIRCLLHHHHYRHHSSSPPLAFTAAVAISRLRLAPTHCWITYCILRLFSAG